jgi:hypothetical protein
MASAAACLAAFLDPPVLLYSSSRSLSHPESNKKASKRSSPEQDEINLTNLKSKKIEASGKKKIAVQIRNEREERTANVNQLLRKGEVQKRKGGGGMVLTWRSLEHRRVGFASDSDYVPSDIQA